MCGEKRPVRRGECSGLGSPPRVRGKGSAPRGRPTLFGITPACAGKRPAPQAWPPLPGDHPRVCGEKIVFVIVFCSLMGSPPRVRGKDPPGPVMRITGGITPACAGKSHWLFWTFLSERDHPRVCGEKAPSSHFCTCSTGSPPRVRGKDLVEVRPSFLVGITPACAGKSVAVD